jgi:hypothetical protein
MPLISRRAFLGALAAAVPAASLVRYAHAAAVDDLAASGDTFQALGETVLPAELGRAETTRVVRDFQRWIAGYREGTELLHGYGTSLLETSGPTPATRWMAQLDDLDAAARRVGGSARTFAALSPAVRRQVVQGALDAIKAYRIPPKGSSPHVALALLAHYYGSAEATDQCYRSRILRQACRPLATSTRQPLPLAGERA